MFILLLSLSSSSSSSSSSSLSLSSSSSLLLLLLLLLSHQKKDPPHKAKIFAKLVMEGPINSALQYLTDDGCGGVWSLNDDVMKQLHEKHLKAQPAKLGSLLFRPVEEVHESAYNEILRPAK